MLLTQIVNWIVTIGIHNQNVNLGVVPMHVLDLILDLHNVVLTKIHTCQDCIYWQLVKLFKLNILPTCQIIMQNKGIQARLHVLYEIHKIGFIVADNGDLPILGLLCLTHHFTH